MAERTITIEQIITSCDICDTENSVFFKCPICGKTICSTCRRWNQCKECWGKNECYATISTAYADEDDHGNQIPVPLKLTYDSPQKHRELRERFINKKVRITFEEVLSKEAIQKAKHDEQMKGDDPTEWHEICE